MLISPINGFYLAKQAEKNPPGMVFAHLLMTVGFVIFTAIFFVLR